MQPLSTLKRWRQCRRFASFLARMRMMLMMMMARMMRLGLEIGHPPLSWPDWCCSTCSDSQSCNVVATANMYAEQNRTEQNRAATRECISVWHAPFGQVAIAICVSQQLLKHVARLDGKFLPSSSSAPCPLPVFQFDLPVLKQFKWVCILALLSASQTDSQAASLSIHLLIRRTFNYFDLQFI